MPHSSAISIAKWVLTSLVVIYAISMVVHLFRTRWCSVSRDKNPRSHDRPRQGGTGNPLLGGKGAGPSRPHRRQKGTDGQIADAWSMESESEAHAYPLEVIALLTSFPLMNEPGGQA